MIKLHIQKETIRGRTQVRVRWETPSNGLRVERENTLWTTHSSLDSVESWINGVACAIEVIQLDEVQYVYEP